MQDIPDGSIDLVLCDLPFGVTSCRWDSIIPFPPLWEQYKRIIKPNGAIVLFSIQPFTTRLIQSNLKDFRYCWYWVKNAATGFTFARYQPMRRVEDICVFYGKHGTYNPQGLKEIPNPKTKKKRESAGDNVYQMNTLLNEYTPKYTNYPHNILHYSRDTKRLHPTQKPVPLLEYLIRTYTNEGETVLDNCMGSGSCGVAAVNTGRRFIGIEKDVEYFEIAEKRINKVKEQLL